MFISCGYGTMHGAQASERKPVTFEQGKMEVQTSSGKLPFMIEIARTQPQLEHGLMHRLVLPENFAMLFIFGNEQIRYMWMKDTPSSLDMLFVDRTGRIVGIRQHTTPFSTDIIKSDVPVPAVIEMPAGTVEKRGIQLGDRIIHPYFRDNP